MFWFEKLKNNRHLFKEGMEEIIHQAKDIPKIKNLHEIEVPSEATSTIALADKIGMLYQSRLIAYGERDEVLNSENEVVIQYFSRSTKGPIEAV